MNCIKEQLLTYIQENYSQADSLFLSEEDFRFFQNRLPSPKDKNPLPSFSLPVQEKKEAPLPKTPPAPPSPKLEMRENPKEKIETPPPSSKSSPPEHNWTLELSLGTKISFIEEMKECVRKVLPSLSIVENIPSDTVAKQSSSLWKEALQGLHVVLLSYGETPSTLPFLENVASALNALQIPAKVVDALRFEKEKKWPLFFSACKPKCILAPPFTRWNTTSLAAFYKEKPTLSLSFLEETPLLFLEPLTEYLKQPLKKKELWNTLLLYLSS